MTHEDAYARLFAFIEALASTHETAVRTALIAQRATYVFADGRVLGWEESP